MVGSLSFLLSSFEVTPSAMRYFQHNFHFLCPITKSDVCLETEIRRLHQLLKSAGKVKRKNGSEAVVAIRKSSHLEPSNPSPILQYSNTPILQYSSTPALQYSNTPIHIFGRDNKSLIAPKSRS
jgi:hypothetical protein